MAAHEPRRRQPSEVLRRGYSADEVAHIYELGRFFLETGATRRAETIFQGLTEAAPDFALGWLGMAVVHIYLDDYQEAVLSAQRALKVDSQLSPAMLVLSACHLTLGDYNSAGTLLGEVGELIENGQVRNPDLVRFFRIQFVRYQNRERG